MRIEIREFGDWEATERRLRRLGYDIHEGGEAVQKKIVNSIKKIVKGHLRNQDIPYWDPLNPEYAKKRKKKYGGGGKILYRTGAYYRAIGTYKYQGNWVVGVKRSETYSNGQSIADIGIIHETRSTLPDRPFRPLWVPSIYEFFGTKMATREVLRGMALAMHKAGWRKVTISQFKV